MYRQAVTADPTNVPALTGYGWLHMQKKCFARAQQCFSDALMFSPENSQALCGIAAVLIHMYRRPDAAEHHLKLAAASDGTNDWVPVYLGIIAQKWRKEYDRAKSWYIQVCVAVCRPASWSHHMRVCGRGADWVSNQGFHQESAVHPLPRSSTRCCHPQNSVGTSACNAGPFGT